MPTLQETLIDLKIGIEGPLSQKILDRLNNASSKAETYNLVTTIKLLEKQD